MPPLSLPPVSGAPLSVAPIVPARVLRPVDAIVIHCSATPSGKWLDAKRERTPAQVIDEWHAARGFWRDHPSTLSFNASLPAIGYHYVIDLDGQVYTGRSCEEIGAHVAGHNARSIGICLVGGAEPVARYTGAQWATLMLLVTQLADALPRLDAVVGHRDLSPDANGDGRVGASEWLKTCPGFSVRDWLFRGMHVPAAHLIEPPAAMTGAGNA